MLDSLSHGVLLDAGDACRCGHLQSLARLRREALALFAREWPGLLEVLGNLARMLTAALAYGAGHIAATC